MLLIEQPFGWDDIYEHSKLQRELKTPICLDEIIHSLGHAARRWSSSSLPGDQHQAGPRGRLHRIAPHSRSVPVARHPVWCGGMLETGIGRAGNVALASLPNFTLPGDISASNRYYAEDIAEPAFEVAPDGTMAVPAGPGIGVEVMAERLAKVTMRREEFRS